MPIDLSIFTPAEVIVAGRAFTYKCPPSMSLLPHDRVVVDFGTKGFVVGTVESVGKIPVDPNAKFKYKWIVAKVDTSLYAEIFAAEADAAGLTANA